MFYPGFGAMGQVPPPMKINIIPISGGAKGTRQTLERMKQIVWKSIRDKDHGAYLRKLALKVVIDHGCRPKDFLCEARAIHEYVRDHIRWTRDIRGHETLMYPLRTNELRGGDCDDKCCAASTYVWVKINGFIKRMMIKDLVQYFVRSTSRILVTPDGAGLDDSEDVFRPGDDEVEVLSVEGNKSSEAHPVWKKVTGFYRKTGSKKLIKVTTSSSRSITVTPEHRLFKKSCRRMVEVKSRDLKVGDSVFVLSSAIPSDHVSGYRDEELWLWGLWLADGSYGGKYNFRIACGKDEDFSSHVIKEMGSLGLSASSYKNSKGHLEVYAFSGSFVNRMKELGFIGDCYSKRVPEWVFSLSIRQISIFLNGYFHGDGHTHVQKKSPQAAISCVSVSSDLLKDIQDLLWRLGVSSSVHCRNDADSGFPNSHIRWVLCVADAKSISRFWNDVGFSVEVLGIDLPAFRERHGVVSRKVKKIEELEGDFEIFDLEVEGTHRFVADGFLTHNTMLLSAMALELGFPGVRFVAIGANPAYKEQYTHVFAEFDPTGHGKWIGSDPTVEDAALGWQSPVQFVRMELEL